MPLRYLIIGGGVAGTTAAETIRKNDPVGEITIVSDEPHRLYSRIMISKPHYFLGKVPAEHIWLKKESWYGEQKISLMAGKRAVRLDPDGKKVVLDDGTELGYDRLLLALGVCARRWKIPGADRKGVYYVRTLDDFRQYQPASKVARQGVVVGGGAIGFEMCEMMSLSGLETTLIIREGHYWDPVLDQTAGQMVESALENHGVRVIRGQYVTEALGDGSLTGVRTENGTEVPCRMAAVGIGGFCPHVLAEEAGIAVNWGIRTDGKMGTNRPDIWAAGDAAEYDDPIFGEPTVFGSWSNAQNHGRVAGINMSGGDETYSRVTFYAVSGFGLNIAFVGKVAPLPDRTFVSRGNPEVGYGRLVLKGNRLVGAQLINRTPEVSAITRLIETRKDISGHLDQLADAGFDLKRLP
ncbi:NAD(P)/FAD-dependent oxidoreductase [Candidatus Uhrbacteria bacterium]|nr:NAD(P)/FAD-dependent oxidoreductase [Candidatus Uhrbacteria bacterium]